MMSFSASQCPVIGGKVLHITFSARRLKPFQVKCDGDIKPPTPMNVAISRRDAVLRLTSAALTGFVLSTETAEARVVKPEVRRKIREKLEMQREKAGLSKLKTKEQTSPPSSSKQEDNQLSLEPLPLPLPGLPNSRDGTLVETGL